MLNLTLYFYNNRNTAKFFTKDVSVSSMEEFENQYQTMLFNVPYEKFHLDIVVNNNNTLSNEESKLYDEIVEMYC